MGGDVESLGKEEIGCALAGSGSADVTLAVLKWNDCPHGVLPRAIVARRGGRKRLLDRTKGIPAARPFVMHVADSRSARSCSRGPI